MTNFKLNNKTNSIVMPIREAASLEKPSRQGKFQHEKKKEREKRNETDFRYYFEKALEELEVEQNIENEGPKRGR